MTFKKVAKSIGSALMYFGIYMAWQIGVVLVTTFAVVFTMSFSAGMDIASQMMENGEYTYEEMSEAIMSLEMEIVTDASEWLLAHTVELTIVAGVLTLLTYVLIFALRKKNVFKEVGFGKMPVLPCFGMAFLGASLNLAVSFILPLIPFPEAWWEDQAAQSEILFGTAPWLTVLLTVIVAPLLEEVVFRGLVHTRLKRGMPMLAAMIISAWIFGLMHVSMIAFIYASLLGFMLVWVFEKYKSLLAPILLHFGFNLCAMILDGFEDVHPAVCIISVLVSVVGIVAVQLTAKNKIEFTFPKVQESQADAPLE